MKNFLNRFLILFPAVCSLLAGCQTVYNNNPGSEAAVKVPDAAAVKSVDPAALWRNIDLKKYPDAEKIILEEKEKIFYNSNGTGKRSSRAYILIVNDSGRKNMAGNTLYFNDFYQKIPEVALEIIKPDGRVVKVDLQKKIATESSQMNSNIYDPAQKVLSFGIPGLEVGDIVVVDYSIESIRPRMQGIWCDIISFQGTDPVLYYNCTISAPEKSPLKSRAVKDEIPGTLKQSIRRENGRIIYDFTVSNVPQILPEPGMPPSYLYAMRLLASTAENWQEISRWYHNLCEKRLKAVSPELQKKAKALSEGKNPQQSVRALFDYVSKEIRYTGVTNENTAPGYEPHDVKETFQQKHGVCRDKAALLAAMLREAGLDAFMVLFMAGDPKDPEIPNNYFNHAITGVKMPDGKLVLMDPTDENSADLLPAYAMNKSFLCALPQGDTLRRTPEIPAEKNALRIRSNGVIDENLTLHLKAELTFEGFNDNIYRGAFAAWPEDYRKQFASSALKAVIPGAVLEKITVLPQNVRDLAQPFKIILEFHAADFADIQWGDGVLRMPFIGSGFGALNFMLKDSLLQNRRYPVQFDSTASVDEICELALPENLQVAALPVYKLANCNALNGDFSVTCSGQRLTGKRVVALNRTEVAAGSDYKDFYNAVNAVKSAGRKSVIIKRNINNINSFSAPVVVLQSDIKAKFAEDNTLTVTRRKVLEILNYGGVKEYSELVLPQLENIVQAEFISAKVKSPDGKTAVVDVKNAKCMDEAVSADAPRYPAMRRLVLPLPGVGVKSVIEYNYVIRYKNADCEAFLQTLAGYEPIKNGRIEFIYPAKLARKFKKILPEAGFSTVEKQQGAVNSLIVEQHNVPMYQFEPGTPELWLFAPVLGMSRFDLPQYVGKLLKHFMKNADPEKNPQSAKLAEELTASCKNTAEKIKTIKDYLAKNIRRAGPDVDKLYWCAVSRADITLREGYGNSLDQAILLYVMLKAARCSNINAVLASDLPATERVLARFAKMPQNCFNTVLLRVKDNSNEFYLNDTDQYAPPGVCAHDGMLGLDLQNGELINISAAAGFRNKVLQEWHIVCKNDNSAEIVFTRACYGNDYADAKRFFDNMTPEDERQYLEQFAGGDLSGAKIISHSYDFKLYPGVMEVKLKIPDFWLCTGDYVYMKLPASGSEKLIRTAGKRSVPYWFRKVNDRENLYTVELPDNCSEPVIAGNAFELSLPGNSGLFSRNSVVAGDRLVLVREKVFMEPFFLPVEAYGLLENIQKQLSSPSKGVFLFKSTGK